MDWFPLLNSLRIALISTVLVFFSGIAAAYCISKLPRLVKGCLDVALTLLLLKILGPRRMVGSWLLEMFDVKLTMQWWSAIFATAVVVFPLMYRTARGAFEYFDENLAYAGRT